ncbi:MAG: DegV family protein [Peptococcaceae bacterium]|nr:DegV family protein [Peptococcaceae bacterium]
MPEKIIITSDSTTDLSPELQKQYHIQTIPLGVTLNDITLKDGIDIWPDEIYTYYDMTGKLPKTTAINPAECTVFFSRLVQDGYTVIHFTISSEMSSTYQNCCLAASEFQNVYVIDTLNLSTGGGLLMLAAAEMAEQGYPAEKIVETCLAMRKQIDSSFIIDNLEFLYAGGRCSSLQHLGANLLHLKPCIIVQDGKMTVDRKYRGKFADVLQKYIADRIGDGADIITSHVFITHAGCEESICQQCVQLVHQLLPDATVHLTRAGATISSHCGRNTLGVLFLRKPESCNE